MNAKIKTWLVAAAASLMSLGAFALNDVVVSMSGGTIDPESTPSHKTIVFAETATPELDVELENAKKAKIIDAAWRFTVRVYAPEHYLQKYMDETDEMYIDSPEKKEWHESRKIIWRQDTDPSSSYYRRHYFVLNFDGKDNIERRDGLVLSLDDLKSLNQVGVPDVFTFRFFVDWAREGGSDSVRYDVALNVRKMVLKDRAGNIGWDVTRSMTPTVFYTNLNEVVKGVTVNEAKDTLTITSNSALEPLDKWSWGLLGETAILLPTNGYASFVFNNLEHFRGTFSQYDFATNIVERAFTNRLVNISYRETRYGRLEPFPYAEEKKFTEKGEFIFDLSGEIAVTKEQLGTALMLGTNFEIRATGDFNDDGLLTNDREFKVVFDPKTIVLTNKYGETVFDARTVKLDAVDVLKADFRSTDNGIYDAATRTVTYAGDCLSNAVDGVWTAKVQITPPEWVATNIVYDLGHIEEYIAYVDGGITQELGAVEFEWNPSVTVADFAAAQQRGEEYVTKVLQCRFSKINRVSMPYFEDDRIDSFDVVYTVRFPVKNTTLFTAREDPKIGTAYKDGFQAADFSFLGKTVFTNCAAVAEKQVQVTDKLISASNDKDDWKSAYDIYLPVWAETNAIKCVWQIYVNGEPFGLPFQEVWDKLAQYYSQETSVGGRGKFSMSSTWEPSGQYLNGTNVTIVYTYYWDKNDRTCDTYVVDYGNESAKKYYYPDGTEYQPLPDNLNFAITSTLPFEYVPNKNKWWLQFKGVQVTNETVGVDSYLLPYQIVFPTNMTKRMADRFHMTVEINGYKIPGSKVSDFVKVDDLATTNVLSLKKEACQFALQAIVTNMMVGAVSPVKDQLAHVRIGWDGPADRRNLIAKFDMQTLGTVYAKTADGAQQIWPIGDAEIAKASTNGVDATALTKLFVTNEISSATFDYTGAITNDDSWTIGEIEVKPAVGVTSNYFAGVTNVLYYIGDEEPKEWTAYTPETGAISNQTIAIAVSEKDIQYRAADDRIVKTVNFIWGQSCTNSVDVNVMCTNLHFFTTAGTEVTRVTFQKMGAMLLFTNKTEKISFTNSVTVAPSKLDFINAGKEFVAYTISDATTNTFMVLQFDIPSNANRKSGSITVDFCGASSWPVSLPESGGTVTIACSMLDPGMFWTCCATGMTNVTFSADWDGNKVIDQVFTVSLDISNEKKASYLFNGDNTGTKIYPFPYDVTLAYKTNYSAYVDMSLLPTNYNYFTVTNFPAITSTNGVVIKGWASELMPEGIETNPFRGKDNRIMYGQTNELYLVEQSYTAVVVDNGVTNFVSSTEYADVMKAVTNEGSVVTFTPAFPLTTFTNGMLPTVNDITLDFSALTNELSLVGDILDVTNKLTLVGELVNTNGTVIAVTGSDADLTLGGTLLVDGKMSGSASLAVMNGAAFTLDSKGTITLTTNVMAYAGILVTSLDVRKDLDEEGLPPSVTINGTIIDERFYGLDHDEGTIYAYAGGSLTINEGAVITHRTGLAVNMYPGSDLTMNGGTIVADTPVFFRGRKLYVPAHAPLYLTAIGEFTKLVNEDYVQLTGNALTIVSTTNAPVTSVDIYDGFYLAKMGGQAIASYGSARVDEFIRRNGAFGGRNPTVEKDLFEHESCYRADQTDASLKKLGYVDMARHVEYKLGYVLNGGKEEVKLPTYYDVDSEDVIPTNNVSRQDYIFQGWYLVDEKGVQTTNAIPSFVEVVLELRKRNFKNNVKVYAKWTPVQYYATLDIGTVGTPETGYAKIDGPTNITFDVETKVTLQNPTCNGFTFVGWLDETDGTVYKTLPQGSRFCADHALKAQWEINTYTITYVNAYGEKNMTEARTYTVSNNVTFIDGEKVYEGKLARRDGYDFKGWYFVGREEEGVKTSTISNYVDLVVRAKWSSKVIGGDTEIFVKGSDKGLSTVIDPTDKVTGKQLEYAGYIARNDEVVGTIAVTLKKAKADKTAKITITTMLNTEKTDKTTYELVASSATTNAPFELNVGGKFGTLYINNEGIENDRDDNVGKYVVIARPAPAKTAKANYVVSYLTKDELGEGIGYTTLRIAMNKSGKATVNGVFFNGEKFSTTARPMTVKQGEKTILVLPVAYSRRYLNYYWQWSAYAFDQKYQYGGFAGIVAIDEKTGEVSECDDVAGEIRSTVKLYGQGEKDATIEFAEGAVVDGLVLDQDDLVVIGTEDLSNTVVGWVKNKAGAVAFDKTLFPEDVKSASLSYTKATGALTGNISLTNGGKYVLTGVCAGRATGYVAAVYTAKGSKVKEFCTVGIAILDSSNK